MGSAETEGDPPDSCKAFRVIGGTLPSRLALRAALQGFGCISSIQDINGGVRVLFSKVSNESGLLALTKAGECSIAIAADCVSKGTVFSMDFTRCSDEEIKEYLEPGVQLIRRLKARNHPALNSSPRLLLEFPTTALPTSAKFGLGLVCDVRPHVPAPLRCRNCHQYLHHERECINEQRCSRCGQSGHEGTSCANDPCCAVCGGKHEVTEPKCPQFQEQMEINSIRITEGVNSFQARSIAKSRRRERHPSSRRTQPQPSAATPATNTPSWGPPLPATRPASTVPVPTPAPLQRSQESGPTPPPNPQISSDFMPVLIAAMAAIQSSIDNQTAMMKAMFEQNGQILKLLQVQHSASNTAPPAASQCTAAPLSTLNIATPPPGSPASSNSAKRSRPKKAAEVSPLLAITSPENKRLKQVTISALLKPLKPLVTLQKPQPLALEYVTPPAAINETVALGKDYSQPSTPTVGTFDYVHLNVFSPSAQTPLLNPEPNPEPNPDPNPEPKPDAKPE